ncbi:MAG: hypothetical protein KatS3mg131_0287 [Candidatus Tectimicrobiota bacterium]|nr:MAG: hypothetical protein KatS3mg131_0287 [Candidatus Tectomicrobia bacterium]
MFQWQREMRDRFRRRFDIVRSVDLKYAYGINPWQDKPQVTVDFAKREDVLESLKGPGYRGRSPPDECQRPGA